MLTAVTLSVTILPTTASSANTSFTLIFEASIADAAILPVVIALSSISVSEMVSSVAKAPAFNPDKDTAPPSVDAPVSVPSALMLIPLFFNPAAALASAKMPVTSLARLTVSFAARVPAPRSVNVT